MTLVLTHLALAETVRVLDSLYALERGAIVTTLKSVVIATGIEIGDRALLLAALQNFAATKVNFVDADHAAVARSASLQIASFDRDFDRFAGVKRIGPRA